MNKSLYTAVIVAAFIFAAPASAQVLGPCGTPEADTPSSTAVPAAEGAATTAVDVSRVPLPGEQAPNFELDAVVGDDVRKIKLSDYDGKWRVVCFYPADFTFV